MVDKTKNSNVERKISTPGENINICWSPDGRYIAVGNKVGTTCIADLRFGAKFVSMSGGCSVFYRSQGWNQF